MAKKIYDIKPPRLTPKVEKKIKAFVAEGKAKKRKVVKQPESLRQPEKQLPKLVSSPKNRRPVWVPVSVSVFAVLLIVCVYLFFKLPKAEITIWPKVDTLSFQQTVTADKSVNVVDLNKLVVPAQYFQATKTSTQDFPATGNAANEGKALGDIVLYNKYDPGTPLTLKAGTRFMSDSGKIFVTFQKVVVPAAKKVGSKITPGAVQIQVQAAEGGLDYNIAPANFSVPGLKGTAFYYSIYGVSSKAMAGGYATKTKKVTADDLQQAKDVLTDEAEAEAMSALKNQVSSDYILLENAIVSDVVSAVSKTKADTVAEKFNYEVTATASALAFKKSDLEKFAKDYIISQMAEEKTLLDTSLVINYSASKIDISGGKATLNLDFSAGTYHDVNKNSLSLLLMKQIPSQVDETINSSLDGEVSKIKTNLWPFWVTSVPNNQKAVSIDLEF